MSRFRFRELNWSHVRSIERFQLLAVQTTVFENTVVVSYSSGEIFALDHNNGNILWFDSTQCQEIFLIEILLMIFNLH